MMTKKDVFAMGLAVVLLLLFVTASASAADGPTVMIADYIVEPAVLMPGDTGTITITIKNMDTQAIETETTYEYVYASSSIQPTKELRESKSISAEIETIRLSSKDRGWLCTDFQRTEYRNVGALGPGESIAVAIPIKVTDYASDGTYFPEVYIEVDNGENVRLPVPVKVDSSEVEIIEKDIPSEITLKESKQIAIVVANNRPNSVSGVNVQVKSESEGLEFTPEQIFIGNLVAYGNKTVSFSLDPLSDGNKEIVFEATYKNGDNVHHSELASSVLVKNIAAVRLILVNEPEFVFKGEIAKIEFDVANAMAKDIKAVSVVPEIDGFKILPSESFIGDMEVGDVFSASFDVYTTDLQVGEIKIPFKLVFKDVDTDKRYETPGYVVNLKVKEPLDGGLLNLMLFIALFVIVVIAVVLVWVVVERKRRRREKK